MNFLDELHNIDKDTSTLEKKREIYNQIMCLWDKKIDEFIEKQYKIIKENLKKAVESGKVQKSFMGKRTVETKIFWGGRQFKSESEALLWDVLNSNPQYKDIYEQISKLNLKSSKMKLKTDNTIGNRLVELCKKDGISAKFSWQADSDYFYDNYTLTAKVNL